MWAPFSDHMHVISLLSLVNAGDDHCDTRTLLYNKLNRQAFISGMRNYGFSYIILYCSRVEKTIGFALLSFSAGAIWNRNTSAVSFYNVYLYFLWRKILVFRFTTRSIIYRPCTKITPCQHHHHIHVHSCAESC